MAENYNIELGLIAVFLIIVSFPLLLINIKNDIKRFKEIKEWLEKEKNKPPC